MLNTQTLIELVKSSPEQVAFKDVIAVIDHEYEFTPTAFTNGNQSNATNENNGSCKIFAFASLNQLSEAETLALFGDFYRIDVLQNPQGNDHQNIRQFILKGWKGIVFSTPALAQK